VKRKYRTADEILADKKFDCIKWTRAVRREANLELENNPRKYFDSLRVAREKMHKMCGSVAKLPKRHNNPISFRGSTKPIPTSPR